jgi:excisionase family DNA binding protein
MRDRFYSTTDLARVCGVSISTIKRWTDAGLLRCVRTPGGHRKYRVQDVAEAARRLGLSGIDAEVRPAARVDDLALLLLHGDRVAIAARIRDGLSRGDVAATRQTVLDLHRHGMRLVDAATLVVRAVRDLAAPGDRPASDTEAFAARRAEAAAQSTLRALLDHAVPAPAGAPAALVSATSGPRDVLASMLAQLALAEHGWRAIDLGADTSPGLVRGALSAERPALVVAVHDPAAPALLESVRAAAAAHDVEVVAVPSADESALAVLAARVAAREQHFGAGMV